MILGIVNNLFVYPKFLVLYGTFQMLNSLTKLLSPLNLFGLVAVINRYFNEYRGRGKQFILFILQWFLIGFGVFSLFYFLVLPYLIDALNSIFPFINILKINNLAIYFALLFYSLSLILSNISYTNKRIVVPTLINRVIHVKVLVPLAIIAVSFFGLDTSLFLWIIAAVFALVFVILLSYVVYNGWLSDSPQLDSEQTKITTLKEKLNFGAYGSFNELGMYLAFSLDVVLVYFLLGDKATGFYSIFLFLANVVRLPIDSVSGLFLPLVNTFLREKDYPKISSYYKRLSKLFLFLCGGIFLFIFFAFDDILRIVNKGELLEAKYIFVFISIGILANGLTYMNSAIIIQSEYYRWNLFFIILLAILNVFVSYYLIVYYFPEEYASAGAACGTAISLAIFNFLKTAFVYFNFKLSPFSLDTGKLLILLLVCLFVSTLITLPFHPVVNLAIKGILVSLVYFLPVLKLRIIEDLNSLIVSKIPQLKKVLA